MKSRVNNRTIVLSSALAGVLAVSAASAADAPEYGFKGAKRVELSFVNGVAVAAGGASAKAASASPVPADDLLSGDLTKHEECKAIARALGNAGLEVVEHCKADDLACAKLYLTVQDYTRGRTADRIFLVGVELSQPLTLSRDENAKLTMPTTWAVHTVEVVATDKSATKATCIALRSLGTSFGSQWRLANK